MKTNQKIPFQTAYTAFKSQMSIVDEITYNLKTNELMLWACEGVIFICDYTNNAIGTHEQLVNYHRQALQKLFPTVSPKRIVIKTE